MQIKINLPENKNYIHNLAFVKAIMIKKTIESLNISDENKEKIRTEILEYLKKT